MIKYLWSQYGPPFIFAIVVGIGCYLLGTSRIAISARSATDQYKTTIDSLKRLDALKMRQIDSLYFTIESLKIQYDSIENELTTLSDEETRIKRVYIPKIIRADSYTISQLDSFFTERYSSDTIAAHGAASRR